MSLFDGVTGPAAPGRAQGEQAVLAALGGEQLWEGKVGAGTGATSGKWRMTIAPGGFGWAEQSVGAATVWAFAAVNSWGDVIGPEGKPLFESNGGPVTGPAPMENTTLVVTVTDVKLSKADCYLLAQSGHDGFARALNPAHTRFDGDATVALATGVNNAEPDLDALRTATTEAVTAAIRNAVTHGQ
jgi:L-aminopeptidase/D-esterase-like protein